MEVRLTGEPSGGERGRRSGRRYADLGWTVPGSLCKPETFCSVLVSLSLWVTQAVKESVHLPAVRESQVQSLGREDPLKKGMATQLSILAWRIPWTEEPGGLQPVGLQRVRHD